ncbi:MAG: hypothetical protein IJ099_06280 [Alphaproteobacteria bacterium]|nr:hypothetical protein [Alphaproteobacteria bacterium]
MEDEELKQLPFPFKTKNLMSETDFMVTDCNREAFQMVEQWPYWPESGLVIYGPEGCGKSHLAHMFADKVRCSAEIQTKQISILNAEQIKMRNVQRIADENICLAVENLSVKADNEALFHLFNIYNNEQGRYILWTAPTAPNYMHFSLKDLQSRLNMLPCIAIKEPDDKMMQMLIVKLFNDRQLLISPEILDYIVVKARRSFSYVSRLVAEIDDISLAYQSAVNYFVVNKAIDILREQDDKQLDLFDEW